MSQPHSDFYVALRTALQRIHEALHADISALYPYDEDTDSFYAPLAVGLPDADMAQALPDLNDQLRRFREDQAAGKVPEGLLPAHYGPTNWLLTTRQPLLSGAALHEIDVSFVRRHDIQALAGWPLLVGRRLVGLLYLNYVRGSQGLPDLSSPEFRARADEAVDELAGSVDDARRMEEKDLLRRIDELVRELSGMQSEIAGESGESRRISAALDHVVAASGLEAAGLYGWDGHSSDLTRAAFAGVRAAEAFPETITHSSIGTLIQNPGLVDSLGRHELHSVEVLRARTSGDVLVFADRDQFALLRRLPLTQHLLQVATDLLSGVLTGERLVGTLGESSRTLGAVTRLGNRLLQPGATQDEVLDTAVRALTDETLPELDFEFASFFLLDSTPNGKLAVVKNAGAATSDRIASSEVAEKGQAARRAVPAWVVEGTRVLDAQDIVAYVATRRRAVVVEAPAAKEDRFLTGYPEDLLERMNIAIKDAEGHRDGQVRAIRLREAADRARLDSSQDSAVVYIETDEITLDRELYEAHGHSSLIRVFMPVGPIHTDDSGKRAAGVLEAGFHMSRKRRLDRVQVEALRACATTLAAAVESARLYEDLKRRAEQLEIVTEVSRSIATSIDLEQTLGLISRNMARAVDASLCLIALLEEDESAWYGAASSDMEDVWRTRRVERPEKSIVFDVADSGRPVAVPDADRYEGISPYMARRLGIQSLLALPLLAREGGAIGTVILGQRDRRRIFTPDEVERASGLASQAAMAIWNARLHSREEEEHHIQKDVVLIGFGQWGQKAYKHLLLLKSFFNFRTHVVEVETPGRREVLADAERMVLDNGDVLYWDSPENPAHQQLQLALEPSCYVITYICTPAPTHLPLLKTYYDVSNVILIEKPLGAPPSEYRQFLDSTDGSVEIVAADHYWFKIEVRLLELLLTEERNLRAFLDEIEEVEIEILEEQPPGGSGAKIGMIADLLPHAFAILSLLTPLDRLEWDDQTALSVGRYEPLQSEHETYARLVGAFEHHGRRVKATIEVGKGVTDAKWIKLVGERRMGGRRSFYKFDFLNGEAMDGTQGALRAATRPIRQPGVRDNAHLSMLRHIVEKKHPAVGILSIREALRANARIQQLEATAMELIAAGKWTPYSQGKRPAFEETAVVALAGNVEQLERQQVEAT